MLSEQLAIKIKLDLAIRISTANSFWVINVINSLKHRKQCISIMNILFAQMKHFHCAVSMLWLLLKIHYNNCVMLLIEQREENVYITVNFFKGQKHN